MINISEVSNWLSEEIAKSEAVLNDPFLRSNLDGLDLGLHATKIEYYTTVLNKIKENNE
jgi:O-glycosyl hydrolase